MEAENRLAAAILRGNIEIKETQTMMGALVTQVGAHEVKKKAKRKERQQADDPRTTKRKK